MLCSYVYLFFKINIYCEIQLRPLVISIRGLRNQVWSHRLWELALSDMSSQRSRHEAISDETLLKYNLKGVWCLFNELCLKRAGSYYAQIERRSVTFMDQTMSRGEAFGLKKCIKMFGLSTEVWVEHFAQPKLCSRGRTLGAITS